MGKKQNKKILIWDGIFQGHKYITEEEMNDRKILQKKMTKKLWKWAGFIILFFIVCILALIFLLD